jgi:hypothetical protein
MWAAGFDGFFTRLNSAFKSMLGLLGNEELLECPFLDFVHQDNVEAIKKAFAHLLAGEVLLMVDFNNNHYRISEGVYHIVSLRGTADLK